MERPDACVRVSFGPLPHPQGPIPVSTFRLCARAFESRLNAGTYGAFLTFPHPVSTLPGAVYMGPAVLLPELLMELTAAEIWSRILESAKTALPEQAFRTWLAPTQAVAVSNDLLVV